MMLGNPAPFDPERLDEMTYLAQRFLLLNRSAFKFTVPDGWDVDRVTRARVEAVRVVVCYLMSEPTAYSIGKENGQIMPPAHLFGCPVVIATEDELNGFLFILRDPALKSGVGLTALDHKIVKVIYRDGKYIPAEPTNETENQDEQNQTQAPE